MIQGAEREQKGYSPLGWGWVGEDHYAFEREGLHDRKQTVSHRERH